MMKDSPNNSPFSPKKSDIILLEDCRREIDQLKFELENEKLKTQEYRKKFAVEVKEIKEAAEKEKRKLVDDLRSKWELEKVRESQQLKDLIVREREIEIRQLLRWKDAELRELQCFLQRERNAAVQQARELQKQLAEELLNRGYCNKAGNIRRLSNVDTVDGAPCQCKLQDVLSKLRWEIDGEQAAHIRHLKVKLEVERNLFLKYILEGSKWDFTTLLDSKPKSISNLVDNVDVRNSSVNRQARRPRSLENEGSRPVSPHSTSSRPRSLDPIFTKLISTESVFSQPELPDCLLTETVELGSSGTNPVASYTEDNEDSSAWIVISKETEVQYSSSQFEQHHISAEVQADWLPSMEMFSSSKGLESLEKSQHIDQQWVISDNTLHARQTTELLSALQKLEHRCNTLQEENNLLRKNSFPEADEKVKRLKKKNAELAVIAKRLEERAHKLQETNLKVVNTPGHLKGSSIELCKKTFARQRAKDLEEQASTLLAKDKEIEALEQECLELKSKISIRKECTNWLNLSDFDRLLRESQKEVLRLQRQIAIKYLKESLYLSKFGSCQSPSAIVSTEADSEGVHIVNNLAGTVYGESPQTSEKSSPGNEAKENEFSKKRKEYENFEKEVRKKQKRCEELETLLEDVRSENAILLEQNTHLSGRAAWTEKVESENADLRVQLGKVTEQRDCAIQEVLQLQSKLENLQNVLKHMREVAERRQHLEKEHEEALIALRGRQEEVKRLHQAHVEAKKEHAGAVHLLEARVKDLEEKCRSQTKQFSLLSQELKHFRLCTGKHELSSSALVTSELPFKSRISTPKPYDANQENGGPGSSNSFTDNVKDDFLESEDVHQPADDICEFIKFKVEKALVANEKENKKSPPNSANSVSHNSSKSCIAPEVDTASEMEELDVDSVSLNPERESQAHAKIQVFLARYSYNPFEGPNENPEVELPLTAGEYIYIYGEMDGDGFYEGELMDGRRGLVPSNFVESVPDDDLMTFQPPEVSDLSQSSCHGISFLSSSSSMERSDLHEEEEASLSPLLSHLQTSSEEPRDVSAVPYPRKLTLIKQLARSIVVVWEPPLVPAGCGSIQSYNIYLDAELRQNLQCGTPTKALLEKLDLKTKAYRVSVQSVTEAGNSDRLRSTILVGHGYSIAPTHLRVRSLTATSAEISWQPSNSNYSHAVYLNEEDHGLTKAGTYWYTLRNLKPSTQYNVKVESRPHRTPWELSPEGREHKSTVMQFTTPSAGPPDAPLDVQVELGPTPGVLNISWLPVTIDAAGTSNGVRVTGYAVYADGQKVLEVTSPTAGSVLLGMSHLELLQVSREVSVRTMSLHGESVDSVPAQIPSALLKLRDSLSHLNSSLVSEPPFGQYLDSQASRITRARLTSSPYSPQALKTSSYNAKLTNQSVSNEFEYEDLTLKTELTLNDSKSADSLPLKASQLLLDSSLNICSEHPQPVLDQNEKSLGPNSSKEHNNVTLIDLSQSAVVTELPSLTKFCEVSAIPKLTTLVGTNNNIQEKNLQELPLITYSESNCETIVDYDVKIEASHTQTDETVIMDGVAKKKTAPEMTIQMCTSPESAVSEGSADYCNRAVFRGTSVEEFLETSGEENADAEDSSLAWPADEAEEREISNPGCLHYASANRSSDLSDILEEEEDDSHVEMPIVKRCGQRNHSNIGEKGGQVSENRDHMLQPSMNSQARCCSTRKTTTNLLTYSDHVFGDSKNLSATNLASFEGLKSYKNTATDDCQHLFVALFDYDPVTMSPNPDAGYEELPFKEGQIIKIFGDKDADGFFKGECNGKTGYIPCNMVSELQIENEEVENQLLECGVLVSDAHLEISEASMQVCRSEQDVARTMVAVFDYNPCESSPNTDIEAELAFSAGDVITVFGSMDNDGFYYGELYGQRGLVPSNFLEVEKLPEEENGILSQDMNTQGLSKEQRLRKKRRK